MHKSSKCDQQSHSPSQLLASVSVPGRHGRLLKSGRQSSQFIPMVLWSQTHPEFNCQQKVTNIKDIAIRLPRTRFQSERSYILACSIFCFFVLLTKHYLLTTNFTEVELMLMQFTNPTHIWLAMHGRCTDSKSYIFRIAPTASIINF